MPVAFVVTRANSGLTVQDVLRFALSNGPAYQHPRRVAFISELPWAGTNKVDRKALLEEARRLETVRGWAQAEQRA